MQASADLKQGSDMSANPFMQALQMLPKAAKFKDFCSNFLIPHRASAKPKKISHALNVTITHFFCTFLVRDGICVVAFVSVLQ